MEQKAEYRTETQATRLPSLLCPGCGMQLGYEVSMVWHHHRRGAIESTYFVRTVMGKPVAKIFVRGEIVCNCGKSSVWKA